MRKIEEKAPDAIAWLDDNHPFVWTRSKFSELSKVDYINNNLSECFNSWVVKTKDKHIVDMLDQIRQMIINKFVEREKIARNMQGTIIPSIIQDLNAKSKAIKDHEVLICGGFTAEVTVSTIRHSVNMDQKTCSCRVWQVTGKPCNHALSVIAKLSRDVQMEEFVHEYFSVDRLRKTYAGVFLAITSKHQWARVDLGYKICKPKLRRKPGRPRKSRIKASDEIGTKKRRRCTECNELGHLAKTCQGGPTTKERRVTLSSSVNASAVGSNDPNVAHTSNASESGSGRGSGTGSGGSASRSGSGSAPSTSALACAPGSGSTSAPSTSAASASESGRGSVGRRGRWGRLAQWFGI